MWYYIAKEVKIVRIRCEYKTEKIPLTYRMMFVSLIKEALKKVNNEYYKKLYFFGDKKNKRIKNFCTAVFLKDFKIDNNTIHINDEVIIYISTADYEFGINIYNALLNIKDFTYKNQYNLKKVRISLVKEKKINEEEVVFKTMSPICIKDKNDHYLNPDDENYENELNYVVNTQLDALRGYGLKRPLIFEKVLMNKIVVKEDISDFKNITDKEIYYVNAYKGIFKLNGDVEDLNLIYQSGIGFRRGQAFGMVDLV